MQIDFGQKFILHHRVINPHPVATAVTNCYFCSDSLHVVALCTTSRIRYVVADFWSAKAERNVRRTDRAREAINPFCVIANTVPLICAAKPSIWIFLFRQSTACIFNERQNNVHGLKRQQKKHRKELYSIEKAHTDTIACTRVHLPMRS